MHIFTLSPLERWNIYLCLCWPHTEDSAKAMMKSPYDEIEPSPTLNLFHVLDVQAKPLVHIQYFASMCIRIYNLTIIRSHRKFPCLNFRNWLLLSSPTLWVSKDSVARLFPPLFVPLLISLLITPKYMPLILIFFPELQVNIPYHLLDLLHLDTKLGTSNSTWKPNSSSKLNSSPCHGLHGIDILLITGR